MGAPAGLETRRDARLRRFGLGLGLVLAAGIHAALLWGPRVTYRPALEQARIRRVLVARPYRPPPPPPRHERRPAPEPGRGRSRPEARPAPKPAPPPRPAPAPEPPAPAPAVQAPPPAAPAAMPESPRSAAVEAPDRAGGAPTEAAPVPADEWTALLAELQARGRALQQAMGAPETSGVAGAGAGDPGAGSGAEGYLDPRIRVTVVSYPPTGIEEAHPPIPYPDLRFHRSQLQAGICRVWYRVWTDRQGRIVRRQLKAPASAADRRRYAPFVEAVTRSVEEWPFDAREAEIHVDVLFEIE